MEMLDTTEVMAIFVIFGLFSLKFGCHGNVLYTLARSLQKCLFFDWSTKKTPCHKQSRYGYLS